MRLLPAFLCLALVHVACAWDATGHQVVAQVAWDTLGKTAEGKAARDKFMLVLMKGDAGFLPGDTNDADAFDKASTFCDAIKRKEATGPYIDLADKMSLDKYPADSPHHDQDSEAGRCRYWHYIDSPLGLKAGVEPFVRPFDAVKALLAAREGVVQGNDSEKAWWAYWILHLTGDLHQPLHCVSDFTVPLDSRSGLATGDNGGNGVHLAGRHNLHGFWDGALTNSQGVDLTVAQRAAKLETAYPETSFGSDASDLDVVFWVSQGTVLARTVVYRGITPGQDPSPDYLNRAYDTAQKQCALAGYRLAHEILSLFPAL